MSRDILRLLVGATVISFTGVLVKLSHLGPTNTAFYRMLAGGLMLVGLAAATRARLWHGRRAFLWAAAAGLVFAIDLSFWHRSVLYVGVGLSTMLVSLQVFFVAAFGVLFLRERPGFRLVAAMVLAVAGLALAVRFDPARLEPRYALGVMFGIIPAACYAAYIIIMRRLEADTGPQATVGNLAVVSLAGAALLGVEGGALSESFAIPDPVTLAAVLGLGLIGQVLGWITITRALPKVNASTAGLVLLLQPVLSVLWDVLFFGRRFTPPALAGVGIAIVAIYLGTASRPAPGC